MAHTGLTRRTRHMDPSVLAQQAGHRDFATTKRYIHPEAMQKVHDSQQEVIQQAAADQTAGTCNPLISMITGVLAVASNSSTALDEVKATSSPCCSSSGTRIKPLPPVVQRTVRPTGG